jgi:hypothetical protein
LAAPDTVSPTSFSPDGKTLVLDRNKGGGRGPEVVMHELASGRESVFARGAAEAVFRTRMALPRHDERRHGGQRGRHLPYRRLRFASGIARPGTWPLRAQLAARARPRGWPGRLLKTQLEPRGHRVRREMLFAVRVGNAPLNRFFDSLAVVLGYHRSAVAHRGCGDPGVVAAEATAANPASTALSMGRFLFIPAGYRLTGGSSAYHPSTDGAAAYHPFRLACREPSRAAAVDPDPPRRGCARPR